MSNIYLWAASVALIFVACNKSNDCLDSPVGTQGHNMLLIGNSFFKPYAEQLDQLAIDAGFPQHTSTRITRGGENGRPINFWNDSLTQAHLDIKAALDQGNINVFGMTAGHDLEDRIAGHRAWIDYALQSNPDISIFIAIPQITFPASWDSLALANGFNTIQECFSDGINTVVHDSMVDPLRAEFPNVNIFTVPTGWASFDLAQMQLDGTLLDDIDWFGPEETSLFTDDLGHQGDIIVETGSLVWLNSLYQVDLATHTSETTFNTDLHEIAKHITDNHDPNYRFE